MSIEYEILAEQFEKTEYKSLCRLVKYPDSLYDYIKSGRTFENYVTDFESDSILNGKIVGAGDDNYLISFTGNGQWAIIDLESNIIIDYYSDEVLILKDYFIKFDNLTDYYSDKLNLSGVDDIKDRYNQAVYNLTDENKELKEQLSYADKELDKQTESIFKLEDYIYELNEKVISLIMEGC